MGLWAGLVRIGWPLPVLPAALPMQHGVLMVSGFLGTLIALERVAALRRRWMYAAPLLSGIGWMVCLVFPAHLAGPLMVTIGSLLATGIQIVILRREPKIFTLTIATGVFCWFIGNLFWVFGTPIFQIVWVWAAFLILTIAGERLELSRVLRFGARHYQLFAASALIFLMGAFLQILAPQAGARITGAGMLLLAFWLLRFDIARRNLRHPLPLTRFIATCLAGGYVWLAVCGILNLMYGAQFAGLRYDAELHSVFIGFVFAMIFGHALIIIPSLTQVNIPFRRVFYLPLAFLHFSLLIRITGDLTAWQEVRMWGGLLNEVAILAFIGILAQTMLSNRKKDSALREAPISRKRLA